MPVTRMMDIIGMLETPPNYILSEDVSRNKGHIAAIYLKENEEQKRLLR